MALAAPPCSRAQQKNLPHEHISCPLKTDVSLVAPVLLWAAPATR
jgi:hypothetical protein